MNLVPMEIPDVLLIELAPIPDDRGFFARAFAADEFAAQGLDPRVAQVSMSYNRLKGTLRGMHFQRAPSAEAKLVRCIRGAIFDVAVDLRPDSPTYLRWVSTELTADNRRAVYIPEGFAHGFQTLQDDCDVFYQVSSPYAPALADGVRYDDPAFGIQWPLAVAVMSERDRSWPAMTRADGELRR